MIEGLVSGTVWFVVFLVVHIALFHRKHIANCFPLIIRVFVGCLAGHTVTFLATGRLLPVTYGFIVMACLFILYMPFFYTTIASLSVQTLILLRNTPDKSLSLSELRQHFASEPIVSGRLNTMAGNGYLWEDRGKFQVTRKGRLVARSFAAIKEIWRLGPGG